MKLLALFLLTIYTCYARLGDTPERMIERWGYPKSVSDAVIYAENHSYKIGDTFTFRDGEWTFSAIVIEGRCAKITYSKPTSWTDEQKLMVLNANSQGAGWRMVRSGPFPQWKRDDGGQALFVAAFELEHPAYNRAVEKAKIDAKAQASRKPKI